MKIWGAISLRHLERFVAFAICYDVYAQHTYCANLWVGFQNRSSIWRKPFLFARCARSSVFVVVLHMSFVPCRSPSLTTIWKRTSWEKKYWNLLQAINPLHVSNFYSIIHPFAESWIEKCNDGREIATMFAFRNGTVLGNPFKKSLNGKKEMLPKVHFL